MILKPSCTYLHGSSQNEIIVPLRCFNPTDGKIVVVNVNEMDIPNKRKMKKLAKKIVKLYRKGK